MKKRIYGISVVVAVLSMSMLGVVSADTDANGVKINHINIQDFAFTPQTIVIQKGEWAQFENRMDNINVDIRFVNSSIRLYDLVKYKSYGHKFDDAGVYEYYCAVHPSMPYGKIIVVDNTPTLIPTARCMTVECDPDYKQPSEYTVYIDRDSGFRGVQSSLNIKVGELVAWINDVSNPEERVTIVELNNKFNSHVIRFKGQRFYIPFKEVGTYDVYIKEYPTKQHMIIKVGSELPISTYNPITEKYPLPTSTPTVTTTLVSTYSPTPIVTTTPISTYSPTPIVTTTPISTPVINDANSWMPTQGASCWSSSSNFGECSGKIANSAGHVIGNIAKGFFKGLFGMS